MLQDLIKDIRPLAARAPLLAIAVSCTTVTSDWSGPNELASEAGIGASKASFVPFVWGVNGHPGKQTAYASSGEGLRRQLRYVKRLGATHTG